MTTIYGGKDDTHMAPKSGLTRLGQFVGGLFLGLVGLYGLINGGDGWWVGLLLMAGGAGGILASREKWKTLS